MAGASGIPLAAPTASRRLRWVGRSAVLPTHPHAPTWLKNLAITSSFFGLQLVWSCEMAQASPFLLSLGVSKSMMAVVFVAGPLSGLLAQPLVGVFSDSCKSKFGRRRPYIFSGVIVSCFSVLLLAWAKEIATWIATEGGDAHRSVSIAFAILAVYLIDFSVNVVQAMDRSLLVDVIPPADQASANAWAARMFGFGAVFAYGFGTLDLVRWTGGFLGDEQIKVIAVFTIAFVCITHAVTLTCVQERILISNDDQDDGPVGAGSSASRALQEIWRTIRTIPRPIQSVFNVQFTSWLGWFPILFFTTTWIAEIYVTSLESTSYSNLADAPVSVQEEATRAGTAAMFYHSVVAFATSICIPALIAPTYPASTPSRLSSRPYGSSSQYGLLGRLKRSISLPIPWLTLPLLWTLSTGLFATLLLLCSVATTVWGATWLIALIGFNWACTNWIPFAVLADLILRIDPEASPSSNSKGMALAPTEGSGGNSIMLHSSRSQQTGRKDRPKALASTSTANLHTIGSDSDHEYSSEDDDGAIIDLDRTPKPKSTFVSMQAHRSPPIPFALSSASQSTITRTTSTSSDGSFQDLPGTPATANSQLSSTSSDATAYFDLPPSSPAYPSSPPDASRAPPFTPASPASATLSPASSPRHQKRTRTRPHRASIASSTASTFDYPPNNGNSLQFSFDDESSDQEGDHRARGGPSNEGLWHYGLQSKMPGGGGLGGSTSTIKLPLEVGLDYDHHEDQDRETNPGGNRRTVKIRHSDDFSSLAGDSDCGHHRNFSSDEEGDGHGDPRRRDHENTRRDSVPKIRIGDVGHSEEDNEDDWSHEEHAIGMQEGEGGGSGGDQAGVILGCHNIYLVLPQFLVTALSSIIFAILDPGKSVLASHALKNPPTDSTTSADPRLIDLEGDKWRRIRKLALRAGTALVDSEPTHSDRKSYSSLSLIFRIGGLAAFVSCYICFRMWRDTVKERRRILRTRTGYGRVG
ncbi:uncharacterized protein JCM15063_000948 [Sporobolomyces koalae]|uniref:uncharacterized protein n=1 Tax=Sporobolomyces koalae TaxID=500713 RepID=UPI00316C3A66